VSRASSGSSASSRLAVSSMTRAISPSPSSALAAIRAFSSPSRRRSSSSRGPACTRASSRRGLVGGARSVPGLGCGEGTLRPLSGLGRQLGGLLEEGAGGSEAASFLGTCRRELQGRGDLVVGARRSLAPVPRMAIGIGLRVGDLRERSVRPLPVGLRRQTVDHRPHVWMLERDAGIDLHEAVHVAGDGRVDPDPEARRCLPHECRVTGGICSSDQQELLRVGRQSLDPAPEVILELPRQRQRAGKAKPARELRRRRAPCHIQQRRRVAARLGDHLIAHALVERSVARRLEELARIERRESLELQLRESGELLVCRRACRQDEDDPFRLQASRHESQRPEGHSVEPLRVVGRGRRAAGLLPSR